MWIFILFPVVLSGRSLAKSLDCYTTKNVQYHTFPKYTLEGFHSEVIEYTEKDELRTGPPTCVMFYGFNETHSVAWQGHVSTFALPLQCHINSEVYTHCFPSPNNFTFLELSQGWACCCSFSKCNWNNPTFFQTFEQSILDNSELINRVRSMASVSFCTLLFLVVVVVETVTEVLYQKYFGEGKKRNFELEQDPEPPRGKLKEQMSPSPATPLVGHAPLPKRKSEGFSSPQSSLKVQSTQPSPKSSSRPPLSEIPLESSLKVDKTQEDDPEETAKKPSEMELASTQKGEDDSENVPIPPKPEWKTTKTGRVKRTSMNYEESTYSDLQ